MISSIQISPAKVQDSLKRVRDTERIEQAKAHFKFSVTMPGREKRIIRMAQPQETELRVWNNVVKAVSAIPPESVHEVPHDVTVNERLCVVIVVSALVVLWDIMIIGRLIGRQFEILLQPEALKSGTKTYDRSKPFRYGQFQRRSYPGCDVYREYRSV